MTLTSLTAWFSLFASVVAIVVLAWSAYHARKLRALYLTALVLAVAHAAAYVWLALGADPSSWQRGIWPFELLEWVFVWILPPLITTRAVISTRQHMEQLAARLEGEK